MLGGGPGRPIVKPAYGDAARDDATRAPRGTVIARAGQAPLPPRRPPRGLLSVRPMEQERTILETAILLFRQIADALIGLAGPAEAWLRAAMEQLGVPPDLRTAVLVLGAVALGLAVLRALGGLLRIAVVLALLALVLNALGDRPARPPARQAQAGTPLVVEYSKCSTASGCTMGWMACAAIAASLNPCRISLSLPG